MLHGGFDAINRSHEWKKRSITAEGAEEDAEERRESSSVTSAENSATFAVNSKRAAFVLLDY